MVVVCFFLRRVTPEKPLQNQPLKRVINGPVSPFIEIIQADEDVAIASLTLQEMLYGLRTYAKKVPAELHQMDVLPFRGDDARLSAQLELACEQAGNMTSRIDAMIAAIAVNRNATLFTFNTRHFQCIDALSLLD